MKVLIAATILALIGAQTPATDNGVIEGRVLRFGNSDPISQARVIISRLQPNLPNTGDAHGAAAVVALMNQSALLRSASGAAALSRPPTFSTADMEVAGDLPSGSLTSSFQSAVFTDSTGKFRFDGLSAGRYLIQAERTGYFSPSTLEGSSSMSVLATTTVEPEKPTPLVDLLLLRGGIISGMIRDPMGQPATNVSVSPYNMMYYGFQLVLAGVGIPATTDDRGEFRISGIPPGQYYVGMRPPGPTGNMPGPQGEWTQTLFPGETDPSKASVFRITDGTEVSGINFSIRTFPVQTYRISGTAINPLPYARIDPRTGVIDQSIDEFFLVPREKSPLDGLGGGMVRNGIPANARPNGEFEIGNVKPGIYDLYAAKADFGRMRYFTDRTTLNVQSDINGVSLKLDPGATLSAKVAVATFDSTASQPIKLESLQMGTLRPVDGGPLNFTSIIRDASFDARGALILSEVPSGKYLAGVFPLPKSGCVTDIRQDDKSVLDIGFSPLGDGSPVQFLVSPTCATLSGAVEAADHKPAARAHVVLVPPVGRRWNIEMYKDVKTDDNGRFSIPGVAPGSYTLYAWESTPQFAWRNAEFLSQYEGKGLSVNVIGTAPVDANLSLIPADTSFPATVR